ncbi:CCAAT/enhancer-binding protein gamma [Plakobranchus ocellatus]|uniref:CCAAT/enhancer-binding protein gamma n=1 Tax=Plakobranchus ocellatus TaxID=259542 RepID=A0AAV4B6S7_9GAST|nr:CCAAT/enhancer-binding protein gamma [Plakobranchus ocellatus]
MPPKKSYESDDSESDDPQNQKKSVSKRQKLDKNSEEYRQRRERNNMAVRKSREASRKKAKETMDKVTKLRNENQALEQKVTILNKELLVLKDLFLTHASATASAQAAASAPANTDKAFSPSFQDLSRTEQKDGDYKNDSDKFLFLKQDA